jgi:hypothetical protein
MSDEPKKTTNEIEYETVSKGRTVFFKLALKRGELSYEDAEKLWKMAFDCGVLSQMNKGMKDFRATARALGIKLPAIGLALMLLIGGCAKAHSGGRPEAERVFMDQAGYVCFLVRDEDGKGVGGNCVRE